VAEFNYLRQKEYTGDDQHIGAKNMKRRGHQCGAGRFWQRRIERLLTQWPGRAGEAKIGDA
jgi:hypothetical protein